MINLNQPSIDRQEKIKTVENRHKYRILICTDCRMPRLFYKYDENGSNVCGRCTDILKI